MTRRSLILSGAFVFVIVAAIATPLGLRIWQMISYSRQQRIGAELLGSLREQRPEGVSPTTWDHATGWAITAYHNVCFSEGHVTFDELVRFNHDTKLKLTENVDLQTIDWVWERLAKTGPHGQKYFDKFGPEYRSLVYGTSSDNATD